jgi:hypothetical protein
MRPSCESRTPAPQRQIAAAPNRRTTPPQRQNAPPATHHLFPSAAAQTPAGGMPGRPAAPAHHQRDLRPHCRRRSVAHAPAPARAARARQPPLRHAPAESRPASTGSRALTGSLRPLILGSVRTPGRPRSRRRTRPANLHRRAGPGGVGRAARRPATPPDGLPRLRTGPPGSLRAGRAGLI